MPALSLRSLPLSPVFISWSKEQFMKVTLIEWLNIVVRVMHITFGIAWIGASFYFVFLENALNRTEDVRDELAGNLWAYMAADFITWRNIK
jgi:uncharacterized membrane protein